MPCQQNKFIWLIAGKIKCRDYRIPAFFALLLEYVFTLPDPMHSAGT